MLPLSDGIPARRFPIVNVLLIVLHGVSPRGILSSPQPAKPDARGGDSHRRRIGYSQSCHKLSVVMVDSLRWMLSNDPQAAAAAGLGPASVAAKVLGGQQEEE
jgi:hypothetical protein